MLWALRHPLQCQPNWSEEEGVVGRWWCVIFFPRSLIQQGSGGKEEKKKKKVRWNWIAFLKGRFLLKGNFDPLAFPQYFLLGLSLRTLHLHLGSRS
jgi:hypothetical protein